MGKLKWRIPTLIIAVVDLVLSCFSLLILIALAVILAYDTSALNDESLKLEFENVKEMVRNSVVLLLICTSIIILNIGLSVMLITATNCKTQQRKALRLLRTWIIMNCVLLAVEILRVGLVFYFTGKFDIVSGVTTILEILCILVVREYRSELVMKNFNNQYSVLYTIQDLKNV